VILFSLAYTNNIGEVGAYVNSRALSNATKLIKIQETVCQHIKLKVIANNLFDKFVCCVKKYYRVKQFRDIIQIFIELGYNNQSSLFKVPRLDFWKYTSISYIYNFFKVYAISNDGFKISSGDMIGTKGRER